MAEYVKRLLNGYFFGSHGYSRKIGSHGYSRKIGSSQELAELAKTFSRDFREEELEKLGDEAEANQLKFTEEMRTRLQDKVQDSWSQDLHCRPFIEQVMAVPAGYPIIQTTAPPQFQLTPQGLIQTQPQQQFGYLTPQGIIVNQPAQAPAPGFFPTAASPFAPGTTATATASGQIIYSPQPPPAAYLPAATPGYPAMSHLMTQTSIPTPIPPPHTPLPAPPPPTSSAPHITPSQQKKIARVQPQPSKVVRPLAKLDANGCVPLTEEDFVNEQDSNVENAAATDDKVYRIGKADPESEEHILYEVTADDGGFHAVSADASELWRQVFEAVQAARSGHGMRPLPLNPLGEMGMQMIGLAHSALSFLLRQMPAARASTDAAAGKPKVPKRAGEESDSDSEDEATVKETQVLKENKSGSVRSEPFRSRAPLDMFSWLASRHRTVPHPGDRPRDEAEMEMQLSSSNRRATSLDLPMAMRFRELAKFAKEAVGVFRSGIHRRGLYCKREIQSGE